MFLMFINGLTTSTGVVDEIWFCFTECNGLMTDNWISAAAACFLRTPPLTHRSSLFPRAATPNGVENFSSIRDERKSWA